MALRVGQRIGTVPPPLVVIATPTDRRVELLQAALARGGFPLATLISYEQVIAGGIDWKQVVPPGAVIRLESPGKSTRIQELLIQSGGGSLCPLLEGEWREPTAWYRGFCMALDTIEAGVAEIEGIRWMNPPADVALMFDKVACHAHLHAQGLPVAPAFSDITSFHALISAMREAGVNQVFVKSRYGSSAAGIIALRVNNRHISAITTLEGAYHQERYCYFNTRRLRHLTDPLMIQSWVDMLCEAGAHIERWIPKAGWRGKTFDVRLVVIGGRVRHQVIRMSDSPITNLHLLNERNDTADLIEHIGRTAWQRVITMCEQVMATFPDTRYAGLDIALTPHTYQPVVLEVNAFGDLLPDVLHEGQDTYAAELAECGWG